MADYFPLYRQYGNEYGLPDNALAVIATLESGHDASAQNPWSSAGGLFQFTDGTAQAYGIGGNRRMDPSLATKAAAQLAQDNADYLRVVLGREPTVPELYLAHQQGMGGAAALLGNPGANVVDVLTNVYGSRAKAEQVVKQNGGKVNQTAGQFSGHWTNKATRTMASLPQTQGPRPATMSNTLGAIRNLGPAGTPDVESLYAGIYPKPAPRTPGPASTNDMVYSSGISDSVAAGLRAQSPALATALERYIAGGGTIPRNATPGEVMVASSGSNFTQADGPLARPRQQNVGTKRQTPGQSGYAGQEQGMATNRATPPTPAQQSSHMIATRATDPSTLSGLLSWLGTSDPWTEADGPVVATIPTKRTGQPPTNRTVQTTRVWNDDPGTRAEGEVVATIPTKQRQRTIDGLLTANLPWSAADGPTTSGVRRQNVGTRQQPGSTLALDPIPRIDTDLGTAPGWGAFREAFPAATRARTLVAGPAQPNGTGYGNGMVKEDNLRLAPGVYPQGPIGPQMPAGGIAVTQPLPRPRPNRNAAPTPATMSASLAARRSPPTRTGFGSNGLNALAGAPRLTRNPPRLPAPTLRVTVNGAGSYGQQPPPVPRQRPASFGSMSPVQAVQAITGMSAANAYEFANAAARGSLGVADRITGAGTMASSGASANSISSW